MTSTQLSGDAFIKAAPKALETALKIIMAMDRNYTAEEWLSVRPYFADIDIKLHACLTRDPSRVQAIKQRVIAAQKINAKLDTKTKAPPPVKS